MLVILGLFKGFVKAGGLVLVVLGSGRVVGSRRMGMSEAKK